VRIPPVLSQIAERVQLRPNTSRGSLIVIQQATEPTTSTDPALTSPRRAPIDKPILESLVIPLAVVVIDEFPEGASKVALAGGHHPIEALVLMDRTNRSA
jgi:hypothetical protein